MERHAPGLTCRQSFPLWFRAGYTYSRLFSPSMQNTS